MSHFKKLSDLLYLAILGEGVFNTDCVSKPAIKVICLKSIPWHKECLEHKLNNKNGKEAKHKDPGLNISYTRDWSKTTKTAWLSCNYVILLFQCSSVGSKVSCFVTKD